jgi:hypothetical protein
MVEDEKFFAWLDGELPPDEATRVEAEVAADPALSRRAEEHRAMAAGLRRAFASVASAPVPDRIAAVVHPRKSNVVDLARVREVREARRTPLWAQIGALAATLAVGIFTGNLLTGGILGGGPTGPIASEGGRLVASADLEGALYTQLASAPADSGPRIGLTFRDKTGAICRTFQDDNSSGLACREGGDWRIRGLFQAAEGQGSDYRMAAGADPRLMDMVEESMAGEPFDGNQEKVAQAREWR